ncbi:hypothetical protein I7I48_06941 [Histoplasma ohiense]|nr:hypothetical protein I7I48_06941 [Histoplasma ohiense (nom. inval.)]
MKESLRTWESRRPSMDNPLEVGRWVIFPKMRERKTLFRVAINILLVTNDFRRSQPNLKDIKKKLEKRKKLVGKEK